MPDDDISHEFTRFAAIAESSPLYRTLAPQIAQDEGLLQLAAHAPDRQPTSRLLTGAVHYLLLGGIDHPLAAYYASRTDDPAPPENAFEPFKDFCMAHREQIAQIMATRLVQTNEVGRCVGLLPAFGIVARETADSPLALVEIGASAGLNLLWDRYRYIYEGEQSIGPADSPVTLRCVVRGRGDLPIPERFPQVGYRVGIDLAPVDLHDPDAVRWLRALVWPEHRQRDKRLMAAISIAQEDPPEVTAGDFIERLPALLERIPEGMALCVYHTLMAYQLPDSSRDRLKVILSELAHSRKLHRVAIERHKRADSPTLKLASYEAGSTSDRVLAHLQTHGEWLMWM